MPQETYSPEVREIISYKPVWIVRNGNMLFLLIVLAMLAVSFVVKYPDVVQASATLTSINAPKEVLAKTTGLLEKLNVKEGEQAVGGQILGFLESTADHKVVLELDETTRQMQEYIQAGNISMAVSIFHHFATGNAAVGELSPALVTFSNAHREFNQYLSRGYFLKKRNMLSSDINYLQRLHAYLLQQKRMQTEDVALAQKSLDANRSLDSDRVISPLDYRNEQSKFIGKALSLPQVNAAIVSNESGQHEKQKEIAALDNEISQQKEIFRQALQSLHAAVEDWKSKYLLVAPTAGKISFAGFVQEKQQVKAGETICFIDPGTAEYFAQVVIPQNNFGKITEGQKVKLKLLSYPYQEFGTVQGALSFVNNIPSDSGFVAKVLLPEGLLTNYKKKIVYHDGLTAQAEIITANTSLAQRIFNQLISAIKN